MKQSTKVIYFVLMVWFGLVWFIVFNATFNTISVISWRLILMAVETSVPGENHLNVKENM
jgi:hypothetical protein